MEEEKKPNLDEALDALTNPPAEDEKDPTPDPQQLTESEDVPEPTPSEEEIPPEDPKPPEEDSSVIRNLRKQYRESSTKVKQYEDMIKRVAEQQGIDPEQLMEQLQNQADEKNAKEKGISPEIQKQLREQEEKVRSLQEERNREIFDRKFDELVKEFPMDTTQAQEFIQAAIERGFDLGQRDLDFRDVYFALNRESVLKEIRKRTEQEVLARIEKQRKDSPDTTKRKGQSDGTKKGSLDDALGEILI